MLDLECPKLAAIVRSIAIRTWRRAKHYQDQSTGALFIPLQKDAGTAFYRIVNVAVDAEVWPVLSSITVILTSCRPGSVFDISSSRYP